MNPLLRKSILFGSGIVIIVVIALLIIPGRSIAETPPCALGTCPKEIKISDNGRTLTYQTGSRFNVALNRFIYPSSSLRCDNNEVVDKLLVLEDLYPNQIQRFIVKNSGSCLLQAKDFSVTIIGVTTK